MDDDLQSQQRLSSFDTIILPAVLVIAGSICILTVDHLTGHYFQANKLPGELRKFFDAAEHFGTPYGQILALLCVTAAVGYRENRVFRIFLGTCCAGIAANIFKLMIGRTRPKAFDFDNQQVFDGFVKWFPFGFGGSEIQSFPSAHTASAFGFAALLTWAYPKGRAVFLMLGAFVALHRITTSAHYPSDVFVGAAVGWSVGLLFTYDNWLGRKFDRLERRLDVAEEVLEHELEKGP